MWLLDTCTLQIQQVTDPGEHKYAILSHTWEAAGEVNFQQIQQLETARGMSGFDKIERTCSIARSKGIKLAWIDTCCIDKTSSAELSEAINSMFRWYQQSAVCFVYLADLEPIPATNLPPGRWRDQVNKKIRHCRWFTRGWTLQELIAPREMEFFDREWNSIGGKHAMARALSAITTVDPSTLKNSSILNSIPVARKMSWAAGRQTTRVEDRAYSLLGIFDINMPLIYGEGPKAFLRLQQQIANQNNDLSLFAWKYDFTSTGPETEAPKEEKKGADDEEEEKKGADDEEDEIERIIRKMEEEDARREKEQAVWEYHFRNTGPDLRGPEFAGIFAPSPDEFRYCSTLRRHLDQFQLSTDFSITNSGLRMEDNLHRPRGEDDDSELILSLGCVAVARQGLGSAFWLGIPLTKVGNTYFRSRPVSIETARSRSAWGSLSGNTNKKKLPNYIYIQTALGSNDADRLSALMKTGIVIVYSQDVAKSVISPFGMPEECWQVGSDKNTFVFNTRGRDNFLGIHFFRLKIDGYQQSNTRWQDKYSLVCALQWTGGSYKLKIGIFRPGELGAEHSAREEDLIMKVRDNLLVKYSGDAGLLRQEAMPKWAFTAKSFHLQVRQIQKSDENHTASPFTWKEGYFHVLLEMREGI